MRSGFMERELRLESLYDYLHWVHSLQQWDDDGSVAGLSLK